MDKKDPRPHSLHLAVQGGGMRVAYALGAMRALKERRSREVATFSCSSAGAVAPFAYMSADIEYFNNILFTKLSGRRFINPRRFFRISDIDYFVDEVLAPIIDLSVLGDPSFPKVSVSVVDSDTAMLRYVDLTPKNAIETLRATMAVPVLFGKSVRLDGSSYVDGGIGDALPLLHALFQAQEGDVVIPVATKPISRLESHDVGFLEKVILTLDPRVKAAVRHLLLSPSPLVELTVQAFKSERIAGISIAACEPSDPKLSFSRTNIQIENLRALAKNGYEDLTRVLSLC